MKCIQYLVVKVDSPSETTDFLKDNHSIPFSVEQAQSYTIRSRDGQILQPVRPNQLHARIKIPIGILTRSLQLEGELYQTDMSINQYFLCEMSQSMPHFAIAYYATLGETPMRKKLVVM